MGADQSKDVDAAALEGFGGRDDTGHPVGVPRMFSSPTMEEMAKRGPGRTSQHSTLPTVAEGGGNAPPPTSSSGPAPAPADGVLTLVGPSANQAALLLAVSSGSSDDVKAALSRPSRGRPGDAARGAVRFVAYGVEREGTALHLAVAMGASLESISALLDAATTDGNHRGCEHLAVVTRNVDPPPSLSESPSLSRWSFSRAKSGGAFGPPPPPLNNRSRSLDKIKLRSFIKVRRVSDPGLASPSSVATLEGEASVLSSAGASSVSASSAITQVLSNRDPRSMATNESGGERGNSVGGAASASSSSTVADLMIRSDGWTALHLACLYQSDPALIELLVRRYPRAAAVRSGYGLLPLHVACGGIWRDPLRLGGAAAAGGEGRGRRQGRSKDMEFRGPPQRDPLPPLGLPGGSPCPVRTPPPQRSVSPTPQKEEDS